LLAPVPVNLVCFRFHPRGVDNLDTLNQLNERLLENVNATGKMYITHTKLGGAYTLRMAIAQTNVTSDDVAQAWDLLKATANALF
jgi:aromatic-L-amino-acid decarboxylase